MLSRIGASYSIAGLTVQVRPSRGEAAPAPSMDVTRDLTDLLLTLGEAARQHGRGVVLLFDELQFAATDPLGALVTALHEVAQRELLVTMVAAGLPQTRGVLAEAASYAERMFALAEVGPPTGGDARRALVEPAEQEGISWTGGALGAGQRLRRPHRAPAGGPAPVPARHGRERGCRGRQQGRRRAAGPALFDPGGPDPRRADPRLICSPRLGYASFTVPQLDDHLRRHHELERHEPQPRPGR